MVSEVGKNLFGWKIFSCALKTRQKEIAWSLASESRNDELNTLLNFFCNTSLQFQD